MISALECFRIETYDPYENLALEKVLTLGVREGECLLILWQNRDTVVIGRNQNAWEECALERFRSGGGRLARRLSGGGAVYHDLGNLNFSFAVRKGDYDPVKQSEVVLRAVRALGVPAVRTGRNDIEAEDRKFSGSAYFEKSLCCCHHGTLMMDVDLGRMEEALTPPRAKLSSRGVSSVRKRVVNLKSFCPSLDRAMMETALREAFREVYGLPLGERNAPDRGEVLREKALMASEEWILGRRIPFSAAAEERFSWGGVRLEMSVREGRITEAVCRSDAMDADMILMIADSLKGCPYESEAMAGRVLGAAPAPKGELRERMAVDMAEMILEQVRGTV
ncbi:MAG: lipoate--protein ligase [Clostridia bacterium]|nr:lipoate--protein ligase [Clostridia bacterium]